MERRNRFLYKKSMAWRTMIEPSLIPYTNLSIVGKYKSVEMLPNFSLSRFINWNILLLFKISIHFRYLVSHLRTRIFSMKFHNHLFLLNRLEKFLNLKKLIPNHDKNTKQFTNNFIQIPKR